MFVDVPAVRDIYSGYFGAGVKERVNTTKLPPRTANGFGMSGLEGWFDGVDWGSLIETGANTASKIALSQFGQPNLKEGQSIQRVRNADGSYSEVLMQQPKGTPTGFFGGNTTAAAAGLSTGMIAVIGVGLVAIFMMQGRR